MMLRVKQVCERLGISKLEVVYRLISSGELRAINIGPQVSGGRPCWRIHEDDLALFIDSRRNHPPAPKTRRRKPEIQETEYF